MDVETPATIAAPTGAFKRLTKCDHLRAGGPTASSGGFVTITLPSGVHVHMELCTGCAMTAAEHHPRPMTILTAE